VVAGFAGTTPSPALMLNVTSSEKEARVVEAAQPYIAIEGFLSIFQESEGRFCFQNESGERVTLPLYEALKIADFITGRFF